MPEIICRKSPGKSYTFKLYTPAEIKRTWLHYKNKHIYNLKEGCKYILIDVRDEEEALVMAALIIRKANVNPPCIQYWEEQNKILVNCEYIGVDFDEMKDACRFLTKIYLGLEKLKELKLDLNGDPLLRDPNQDIEDFYMNRNFPSGAHHPPATIEHVPMRNIHEYISPDMRGII